MAIRKRKPLSRLYDYNIYTHGVTQSMIAEFKNDRHTCRLKYLEGWATRSEPIYRVYGQASHWCTCEIYKQPEPKFWAKEASVKSLLSRYHDEWKRLVGIPSQRQQEDHELVVGFLEIILPAYLYRIAKGDSAYNDWNNKRWLRLERNFVYYVTLPNGRKIPIRGRFDGVYVNPSDALSLFDSKNLSRIDEESISDVMPLDTQINLYLLAMYAERDAGRFPEAAKIDGGVLNIMRRPAQYRRKGDKFEGKIEPLPEYLARVKEAVWKDLDEYFLRFNITVTKAELLRWRDTQLVPVLSQMERWAANPDEETYLNEGALTGKYGRSAFYNAIVRDDWTDCYRKTVPFTELEDM